MDLAASIQQVTDEIMLKIVRYARAVTGKPNLCLAGGVALNCVANGKILRSGIFDDVWIQPAAGDAGGALGAALYVWHQVLGHARNPSPSDCDARGAARSGLRARVDAGVPGQERPAVPGADAIAEKCVRGKSPR